MQTVKKIKAFINAKPKSPNYTRQQWFLKCGLLALSAFALDVVGQKIASIDFMIINGLLNGAEAHNFQYLFYCAAQGLLIGLCFWRCLEIYWWGNEKVKELQTTSIV